MPVNFLDQLTTAEREMLVSLPYRVGLRVSQSDDTGGDESDEIEAQTLNNLLTGFSQEMFGAETVQYVIGETVQRKAEWAKWAEGVGNVETDCHKAIDILSGAVDPKEVSAFKSFLVQIGESVAMAFREYGDDMSMFQRFTLFRAYQKGKSRAEKLKMSYKSFDEFLNISLKERKALESIAHSLGLVYV